MMIFAASSRLPDAAADFEAGQARQVEVDDGDVRLPGEIERLARLGVGGVAHLDLGVGGEQRFAAGNDDRMIVDDQNPQKLGSSLGPQARAADGALRGDPLPLHGGGLGEGRPPPPTLPREDRPR